MGVTDDKGSMAFFVYILYSDQAGRHYTGCSQYHWKRQRQHRQKHNSWSGQADDWVEKYCTPTGTMADARKLEKKIKSRGVARFLKDIEST